MIKTAVRTDRRGSDHQAVGGLPTPAPGGRAAGPDRRRQTRDTAATTADEEQEVVTTTALEDEAGGTARPAHTGAGTGEEPLGDGCNGEHDEIQRRDLLLAFIDRRRLQQRLDEVVTQAGWRAAEPSHSREELVLRLDWRRLEERFGGILREEVAGSHWRFGNRYADAVRGVDEVHAPVADSQGNRVCAADGEVFACRTLREVYAAQEMAWDGWDDHGYPDWRGFTDEDAAASRDCYQQTGLHWRPGIGLEYDTRPAGTDGGPSGAGQLTALGERVRQLRAAAELARDQVAGAAGIPAGQLYALEAGNWNLDLSSMFRLAAALGVPATALLPDDATAPGAGGSG
jgi:DNA-binding XRE family transcriptional regulator